MKIDFKILSTDHVDGFHYHSIEAFEQLPLEKKKQISANRAVKLTISTSESSIVMPMDDITILLSVFFNGLRKLNLIASIENNFWLSELATYRMSNYDKDNVFIALFLHPNTAGADAPDAQICLNKTEFWSALQITGKRFLSISKDLELNKVPYDWEKFLHEDFYGNAVDIDEPNLPSTILNRQLIASKKENTFSPKTKEQLRSIIEQEIAKNGPTCNLNHIDVSQIRDMSALFKKSKENLILQSFNGDISQWDVSHVEDMRGMFCYSPFNGDISGWDVSSVESMCSMFANSQFDGDISNWDVSHVEHMSNMFENSRFTGDISRWDVSHVEDMSNLFFLSVFDGDISTWNVSKVTSMNAMFAYSQFTGDISKWDVSSVRCMDFMFADTRCPFNLSLWNVSNVEDMEGIFQNSPCAGNIPDWVK